MTFDLQKLDTLKEKEIEYIHDEVHVYFNKYLNGGKPEYTFRELYLIHETVVGSLIRAGGKHIANIDQLDKIQNFEESSKKKEVKKKEEFILLEYFKEDNGVKNLWAIQLGKKIFEFESSPRVKEILLSIKKNVNAKGKVLDKGEFKILNDNENLLSVEFLGKSFKGIYNFKRNGIQSDVWKFTKEGSSEKLSENFGASFSNEEIRNISFLSSNKVGASEIANLISRPVQSVYSWIGKLSK